MHQMLGVDLRREKGILLKVFHLQIESKMIRFNSRNNNTTKNPQGNEISIGLITIMPEGLSLYLQLGDNALGFHDSHQHTDDANLNLLINMYVSWAKKKKFEKKRSKKNKSQKR
ncbi:uncharacterized protein LOC117177407 [Belonocnema kinseyi]|uniref:uncharacterized protein LOC117177407 n=1 Tax=Belonocnema kinseyi TaxID=2817044 RepID=UPI00143D738A|nr:uncharacterized protein LOC117177407 [Belonocnema kinseyi]